MDEAAHEAASLFEDAVGWLRDNYTEYEFWVERDVVWTVQTRLRQLIADRQLPYLVLHNCPMPLNARRVFCDLVIRDMSKSILLAAEFKYEPAHNQRAEFRELPGKRPVVFWGKDGVADDIVRIRQLVEQGSARSGFAVFVDEGGYFRSRAAHPGSAWLDWVGTRPGGGDVSVLWGQFASP